MRRILWSITLCVVFLCSCNNKEAEDLKNSLQKEYDTPTAIKSLSSGSKAQYIQMEKNINQVYVKQLDSLINTGFDSQLERFENSELGVWSSYCNMFSWLFKSEQSWEDELNLKSTKYFNSLDIEQDQNSLYLQYVGKIRNLRQQFLSQHQLPQYTQIDLPDEKISLESFSNHSRDNIGIEIIGQLLGSELFAWFLGFVITWILITLFGLPTGPPGWLISIISFIIIIVVSAIMSNRNDSKLMEQLKEQHQQTTVLDSGHLLKELDQNTILFYEKI